jgi:thiamine transporter ThiT
VLILRISELDSYKSTFFLQQIMEGKKYTVILVVEFLDFCITTTSISISGIHNYSNYPCLNFKNIRAVCRIAAENDAI